MVKISTLFKLWLILILISQTGILSSFGIENSLLTYFLALSPLMMFCIIRFSNEMYDRIVKYAKRLDKFLFAYILFWGFEVIYTVVTYHNDLIINAVVLTRKNLYWLDILLVYPILYVFDVDRGIEKIVDWIIRIAVFGNAQRFISWLAYSKAGTVIFPTIIKEGLSNFRSGVYRLGGCTLHSLGFDLAIYKYANENRKKRRYLVVIILFAAYQVIISQSRAHMICYAATLCVALYYFLSVCYSKNRGKFKIVFAGLLFLAFVILIFNGFLSSFFSSFSITATDGGYAGSTINRLYAMDYYWDLFKSRPLFGLGFLYDDSDTVGSMVRLLRGAGISGKTAYLEDLGILGQIFQVGIIGSFFLFWIIIRLFKNARKTVKKDLFDGAVLNTIFVHFILMSCTTMSLFMKSLFYTVPFIMAISEYYYFKNVEAINI